MAWSRISSKVMADPPPLPEACRGRSRNGRAFCPLYSADGGQKKARSTGTYGEGHDTTAHSEYVTAPHPTWGAGRRRTSHQGPPPGQAHPPCGEISNCSNFSRGN